MINGFSRRFSMTKIGFVTDTNLLKKSIEDLYSSKTVLDSTDVFVEYIEALNKTDSKIELLYFMPELVVEELFAQKKIAFDEQYNVLKNKFNKMNYALDGKLPKNNLDKIIKKEKELYLPKYKNIKLEYTKELFEEVVYEAIQKKAPFDKRKEGKKADSGFKDTLIWKTILLSDEINDCSIFYLFSSDKIFYDNKETLKKEFNQKHPNTEVRIIYFDPDGNQRQNVLYKIIEDNNLIKTNVVKLYDKELLITNINSLKYNYSDDVLYSEEEPIIKLTNIMFNDFTYNDFVIDDVNESNSKYEVILSFKTKKYTLDAELDEIDRTLLGKIKLYFKIACDEINLETYKIENVKFYKSYINQILSNIETLYSYILKASREKLNKSLEIDLESFKEINSFYHAEDFLKMYSSINELTKGIAVSSQLEELKKSLSLLNETTNIFNSLKYLDFENIANQTDKENKNK